MSNEQGNDGGWSDSEHSLDGEDGPSIEELLDLGYQQLDGFVEWVERVRGLDTRTAQQDCFNAESFVDYLANHQRKSATDVNEYELRWFTYSHYIRKSIADRETQNRLPESLLRFFEYLRADYGLTLPEWIYATLEESDDYRERLARFTALSDEDEGEWKIGFEEWCEDLENDLDSRCLWLPNDIGDGMTWAEQMGWREAALRTDANRLWQSMRSELLSSGLSVEAARERLVAANLIWLDTPEDRLEGLSPRQTILAERAERALGMPDDDDDDNDDL